MGLAPTGKRRLFTAHVGNAYCCLWRGSSAQSILGLPLMNGYLTIFDGTVNNGLGVVKFATAK